MYFIAIIAPDNINQQVLEWKNYMLHRFNCKVALRSPAHITIIPPFHMPEILQQPLIDTLDAFSRQRHKFHIHLQNFGAFAPRVIFVQVQLEHALQQLKEDTETNLLQGERFPIKGDPRPFHPHMTIANRDLRKKDFAAAWAHFRNRPYQASFEVKSISLLRMTETRWEVIADLPFTR